jgi:ABC-type cobalamin/Fe3+-siderophores transport system ATPase subunit
MRVEFSDRVRLVVAQRCAYRCSFPMCDAVTIGPDVDPSRSTCTGEAAHIYSASERGPRGQGGLTDEELGSTQNAIWLCADHAAYVDKHRGERFPASDLVSFKGLREAQVAREQAQIQSSIGWFHSLWIHSSPVFKPDSTLTFGKVTIVAGDNGSGKSAIGEWLSGFNDPTELVRWSKSVRHPLDFETTYFSPIEQRVRIKVLLSGQIQYFLDDREVPFLPIRPKVVRLPQYYIGDRRITDELALISEVLEIHPSTTQALISFVNSNCEGWFRDLMIEQSIGRTIVSAQHEHEKRRHSFMEMSNSQRAKTLIELCVAAARFSASYTATVLLIDGGIMSLDGDNFRRCMNYLMSPNNHFQSIVTVRDQPLKSQWTGWECVELLGSNTDVVIDQA